MQVTTLNEQLFFTTVRIDTIGPTGQAGAGTGFFFGYKVNEERTFLFVVTNKHVVLNEREGVLTFLKQKDELPTLGDGFRLQVDAKNWGSLWFGHPDPEVDIAICALGPLLNWVKEQHDIDLFIRAVDTTNIPSEEQLKELDAIEPVTFIGYPNGIWDRKNLLPVARRGTTASPIAVDFEGTPRFLIDASVFGGSSGSPVFVHVQGGFANREGGMTLGSRFFFVGVIAAVFYRTHLNQIISVPIPTQVQPMAEQQEMIDLGIVFKARTVPETIEAFFRVKNIDPSAPLPPGPDTGESSAA